MKSRSVLGGHDFCSGSAGASVGTIHRHWPPNNLPSIASAVSQIDACVGDFVKDFHRSGTKGGGREVSGRTQNGFQGWPEVWQATIRLSLPQGLGGPDVQYSGHVVSKMPEMDALNVTT